MSASIRYSGTDYAWVRARVVGGKTTIWGRLALRLSDYDFKAASRDGFGMDWPISYADISPYYDRVDRYLGISGHPENLPQMPDGQLSAAVEADCFGVAHAQHAKRYGPHA